MNEFDSHKELVEMYRKLEAEKENLESQLQSERKTSEKWILEYNKLDDISIERNKKILMLRAALEAIANKRIPSIVDYNENIWSPEHAQYIARSVLAEIGDEK